MFPDRATMYMVGIEDRDYKEDKVECKFQNTISYRKRSDETIFLPIRELLLCLLKGGQMFMVIIWVV